MMKNFFLLVLLLSPSLFCCGNANADSFDPPPPPLAIFGLGASDPFVLYEGSSVFYDGTIYSFPQIDAHTGDTKIDIRVFADDQLVGSILLPLERAHIDAFTTTETGVSDQYAHCCIQAVKHYLENITENSGVTFVMFIS